MAEGGEGKDDNPFSFKKFIKSKKKRNVSSDTDSEDSDEDAVDLLENSASVNRDDAARSNRRTDENPFSFKRFLQAAGTNRNGSAGLATPDLASDLPDFVQDQTRRTSRQSVTDIPLPDFALDSSPAGRSQHADSHFHHGAEGWTLPPIDNSSTWLRGTGTDALDIRPHVSTSSGNSGLHHLSDFSADSDVDDGLTLVEPENCAGGLRHMRVASPPIDGRHVPSANAAGGLPDFLSDSALGAADVCSRGAGAAAVPNDILQPCDILTNGFSIVHIVEDENDDIKMLRLQEENEHLRRCLQDAELRLQQESARAAEAVKKMEISQKHEAEETAALEKVVQQVEANLETATQRALHSETVASKLKQEVRTLQNRVEVLESENTALRARTVNANVASLRDQAINASQQLNAAANDAEQLLKQLLVGVDKLRLVSSVLASTDKVADLPPDGTSKEPTKK